MYYNGLKCFKVQSFQPTISGCIVINRNYIIQMTLCIYFTYIYTQGTGRKKKMDIARERQSCQERMKVTKRTKYPEKPNGE